MAAAYIRGIQKKGVYACPKHFAVNSQELRRMAMNAVVDERTLREIYLTAFEIVVKEGKAKALMTSYNQINGSYANENEHLLKEILREEWEYEGMVVTDWGGSNDHVRGVSLRSNLEMPTPGLDSARQLLKAIQEGRLTEEQLDICVDDLLDAVLELTAGSSVKTAEIDCPPLACRTGSSRKHRTVKEYGRSGSDSSAERRLQRSSDWGFCYPPALSRGRFLHGKSCKRGGNHGEDDRELSGSLCWLRGGI